MLNSKISILSGEMAGAMNACENRLDTRIQSEVEARRKENNDMTQNITEVMERLQKLETNENTSRGGTNMPYNNSVKNWQPTAYSALGPSTRRRKFASTRPPSCSDASMTWSTSSRPR